MDVYSDKEIIRCLKNRNSKVVHYLVDRYLPMIRMMVCDLGGTGEDAKDLFQEAMVIIIKKIDTGDLKLTCQFKTFLYSICKNLWKMHLEKQTVVQNYYRRKLDSPTDYDFSEHYDNKLYKEIFWETFKQLSQGCQDLLKLYWSEMPMKKIAEKLSYTYGYVRKKCCECKSELIDRITNHPAYRKIQNDK